MKIPTQRVLVLGYGNVDRQDDGVAWHILVEVARQLNLPIPTSPDEGLFPAGGPVDFSFSLQLVPEMAETIAAYERICFIDAHTGNVPEEIHLETVHPHFQASPFTHHLTPATLLSFTDSLYHEQPEAILVSVRGYEFGFDRNLSPATAALVTDACVRIVNWINASKVENDK
jgi:hydrogenase maturation protease